MKHSIALFAAAFCLLLSACHRPVAYFQPMPRPVVDRLPIKQPTASAEVVRSDSTLDAHQQLPVIPASVNNSVSLKHSPTQLTTAQVERRMHRIQSLLSASATQTVDQQPEPKPKKKLKLGNQIRQKLGVKLRPELNWWQRISWKLKASVLVILVAVVFAILHITILAIIFGVVGAFLLVTGLKRSLKVRRPWF